MDRDRDEDVLYAWFLCDYRFSIFVMGSDFFSVFDTENLEGFFIFASVGDTFVTGVGDISA